MPLAPGQTVSFILDDNTQPHAVFSMALAAGQRVILKGAAPDDLGGLRIYNPTLQSLNLDGRSNHQAKGWFLDRGTFAHEFTAAVAGTYFIQIYASGTAQQGSVTLRSG